ncbi:unnamed protein product [Soboliphyme baturini]|uniref:Two-component sensor histidine kinase n=1 Tax=Soboliphyme baturini TaxID=241478 RepID=A0A183IVL2_9BILA|nr:unnamed protein product [Soboliphyme baturini]
MIRLDSSLCYASNKGSTSKHLKWYLSEFSLNTSAHGVPLIRKSLTAGGKLFWFLICLACIGAFSYQAYLIVQKFYRREKVVDIQVRSVPAILMTAVQQYDKLTGD